MQKEERLERQEERLHDRAVNAALHGNFGKAVHLEVYIYSFAYLRVTWYSIIR